MPKENKLFMLPNHLFRHEFKYRNLMFNAFKHEKLFSFHSFVYSFLLLMGLVVDLLELCLPINLLYSLPLMAPRGRGSSSSLIVYIPLQRNSIVWDRREQGNVTTTSTTTATWSRGNSSLAICWNRRQSDELFIQFTQREAACEQGGVCVSLLLIL